MMRDLKVLLLVVGVLLGGVSCHCDGVGRGVAEDGLAGTAGGETAVTACQEAEEGTGDEVARQSPGDEDCGLHPAVVRFMAGLAAELREAAGLCGEVETAADPATQRYTGDGFTVEYPGAVRIVNRRSRGDFETYRFTYVWSTILQAYVGNHPRYPLSGAISVAVSTSVVNDLPFARLQVRTVDGRTRTEVLLRFPDDRMWPCYIHLWYDDTLSDKNRQVAEGIIASVRASGVGAEPFPPGLRPMGPDEVFPPFVDRSEPRISIECLERSLQELRVRDGGLAELEQLEKQLASIKELRDRIDSGWAEVSGELESVKARLLIEEAAFLKKLVELTKQDNEP